MILKTLIKYYFLNLFIENLFNKVFNNLFLDNSKYIKLENLLNNPLCPPELRETLLYGNYKNIQDPNLVKNLKTIREKYLYGDNGIKIEVFNIIDDT